MSFWEQLGNWLQKPQSIMTGATLGLMRDFGNDPSWARNIAPNSRNAFAGAVSGAQQSIKPHDVLMGGVGDNPLQHLAAGVVDVAYDPLNFLALAPVKEGSLLARAFGTGRAEGVGRFSGENLANAALRGVRRGYEGTLATTNNDALAGAQTGLLMGAAEGAIAKALPRIMAKTPEIGDTLTDVPSVIQNKVEPKALGMGSSGATEVVPGVPRGNANPIPEFIGNFTGPNAVRGELDKQKLIELLAGRQPVGALPKGEAVVMPSGPRPMGPGPNPTLNSMVDRVWGPGRQRVQPDVTSQIIDLLLSR